MVQHKESSKRPSAVAALTHPWLTPSPSDRADLAAVMGAALNAAGCTIPPSPRILGSGFHAKVVVGTVCGEFGTCLVHMIGCTLCVCGGGGDFALRLVVVAVSDPLAFASLTRLRLPL